MHEHKIEYDVSTVVQGFQWKEGEPCIVRDSTQGYSPGSDIGLHSTSFIVLNGHMADRWGQ